MSSKPRIACLLQMFGIGGMPKWLYRLAGELGQDFQFTFIATHSKYVTAEYRRVAKVVTLPFNKWVLGAYLFAHRIDIAQVANLHLYVDAARLAQVPTVIERVDGLRSGAALGSKEGVDVVIASTKGIIPQLEKLISTKKIRLIYNGVDLKTYEQVAPQRFGFHRDDVIIGRTSRISGGKNVSLLIRAVIELRKDARYRHVRLVVCGGDTTQPGAEPMLNRLKEEAKALGESAVFTGETFETEAVAHGYDIATCTSLPNNEGIPNSLLEAMAAGKPVVASAVDDIPELVEQERTGLLFANDDLNGLITALKDLIDNKSRRLQMGEAGRKKISIDFEIKTQARKYADLYYELLIKNGKHPLRRLSPLLQGSRK